MELFVDLKILESRVLGNLHARFGGGRLEKCLYGNSPGAYPTPAKKEKIKTRLNMQDFN